MFVFRIIFDNELNCNQHVKSFVLITVPETFILYDLFQSGFLELHSTELAPGKVSDGSADNNKCLLLVLFYLSSTVVTVV